MLVVVVVVVLLLLLSLSLSLLLVVVVVVVLSLLSLLLLSLSFYIGKRYGICGKNVRTQTTYGEMYGDLCDFCKNTNPHT